jgi:hypothetical protein
MYWSRAALSSTARPSADQSLGWAARTGQNGRMALGGGDDPFVEFLAELADGQRWQLARSEKWDDFVERVSRVIGDLPLRRRQVLVMLLFALSDGLLSSEELQAWMADRDVDSDEGVEAMIAWLRQFRPGSA